MKAEFCLLCTVQCLWPRSVKVKIMLVVNRAPCNVFGKTIYTVNTKPPGKLTFCVFSFQNLCTVRDERVRARCTTSIIITFTDHGHIPCTVHDKQNSVFTNTEGQKSPITPHDETPSPPCIFSPDDYNHLRWGLRYELHSHLFLGNIHFRSFSKNRCIVIHIVGLVSKVIVKPSINLWTLCTNHYAKHLSRYSNSSLMGNSLLSNPDISSSMTYLFCTRGQPRVYTMLTNTNVNFTIRSRVRSLIYDTLLYM